jgi:hypothetical protein
MLVSVDGATACLAKFRKKGHLDIVIRIENLVKAKRESEGPRRSSSGA